MDFFLQTSLCSKPLVRNTESIRTSTFASVMHWQFVRIMNVKEVPIPMTPDQVNEAWLKSVFKSNHEKNDIEVIEVKAVRANIGYMSSAFQAKILINEKLEDVFIKIMPLGDHQRSILEKYPFDATEIHVYENVLPKLEKFEESVLGSSHLKQMFCKFYAGKSSLNKKSRGYFVILEDVSSNFHMPNCNQGLTMTQILSAIKRLAQFHGTSYCYGKLNGMMDFGSDFAFTKFFENPEDRKFDKNGFDLAIEKLKAHNELQSAIILEGLQNNYLEKFKMAFYGTNQDFLTHRDLWPCNLMFSKFNEVSIVSRV